MKRLRPWAAHGRTVHVIHCVAAGIAAAWMAGLQAQQPQQPARREVRRPAKPEQGIDAYVSQDALQVMYTRKLDLGNLENSAVRGGFFINEQRDVVGVGDVLVHAEAPDPRRRWALDAGARAYGALLSIENEDIFALSVGGEIFFFFGPDRMTSASAAAFYAPDITTFGNADSVTDVMLRLETPVTDSIEAFVGYRWFRFELPDQNGIDSSDRDVDKGVSVGITYRF